MNQQRPVTHFSLIRSFHIADFVTLANGGCGIAAVLLAQISARDSDGSKLYVAAALVLLALVFDTLDGRIARWRHQSSVFGQELDSLADVISFGVAPAAIAFAAGLDGWTDSVVLIFFALCGLSRLARYNVTALSMQDAAGKVTHFEGTPIPTSVVPLGILIAGIFHQQLLPVQLGPFEFHLLVLPFALSGCLMVSKTLRIPKP